MTNYGPWSVKGIDQRAREAAREAAREEGLTIGEYINRMLLEETEGDAPSARDEATPRYPRSVDRDPASTRPGPGANGPFDQLVSRLEAVEARSTLALTGIDQSILGLVTRLNKTDARTDMVTENVEGLIADINATHEKLQDKLRAIEEDDSGAKNLEALKSLEQALGKLAAHVYDENNRQKDETAAVRGRVETGLDELGDRVAGMEERVDTALAEATERVGKKVEQAELRAEGTTRHLSERFTEIETTVSSKLARIDQFNSRLEAVEGDVAGALNSIESVMTRMQERLQRAEATTNSALAGLEKTFESLSERIDTLAEYASPEAAAELRGQFESRFDGLADELRGSIEATRADLAREIEHAASAGASTEALESIEASIDGLEKRVATGEERSSRALENMTSQVGRISTAFDRRLREVEGRDESAAIDAVRGDVKALSGEVSQRLEQFSSQNDAVIDKITAQMRAMADQFDARVEGSEQRSASAIEQVGEQVASVAQRLQSRQDRAFEDLKQSFDKVRKQQDVRLSDALAGVSDRIERMQRQSTAALSPVQKAIASLATRLEAVEDFTTPPHAGDAVPQPPHLDMAAMEEDPAPARAEQTRHAEPAPAIRGHRPDDDFDPSETFAPEAESDERAASAAAAFPVEDDPFEAGIPELDDLEDAPRSGAGEQGDTPEYATDLPEEPDLEIDDPLSALVDWDDGRDETRDSDIFADDGDAADRSFAEVFDDTRETFEDDLEEGGRQVDEGPVEEYEVRLDEEEEEADEGAGDYLSRARRAAMNASVAANGRKATRGGSIDVTSRKSRKVPLVAAVSVVALATAAAGTLITLRGLQDDPGQPVVQTTQSQRPDPTALTAASMTVSEGAGAVAGMDDDPLAGIPARQDTAEGLSDAEAAAIEDELFEDEPLQTTAAEITPPVVEVETQAEAPVPEVEAAPAAPEVDFAALPTIPAAPTLESAAADGNPAAQLMLGEQRLEAGDYTSGPSLVRKAAEAGEPAAQYRLAKLHEKGLGVPKDLGMAREWTERAAEGGNVKAMHDLAVYYAEGESGQQSYAAAAEWFRRAADYGLTDSQYNLAVLYETGLGISPSPAEALYWYEVAARQGDAGAPEKVEELRSQLSLEVGQQAQRRAATWSAASPQPRANGEYSGAAWQGPSRAQVNAVQTVLAALGYEPGPADGLLGEGTIGAIKAYQADAGLEPDGAITPALVESLNQTVEAAVG